MEFVNKNKTIIKHVKGLKQSDIKYKSYKEIPRMFCSALVRFQISDEFMVLSKMCGYGGARPPNETRTNILFVEFHSDNFFTAPGFNMTFEAIHSKTYMSLVLRKPVFGVSDLV